MTAPLVTPEPPDPLVEETRAFWRDLGRDLVKESINTIDETSKQVIAVAGILEGLYFHAIAFSDLRGKVTGGTLVVYLVPVALLLVSLTAALFVFIPNYYRLNINSSEASQLVRERVVTHKLWTLRIASAFLVLGIGAILYATYIYLRG